MLLGVEKIPGGELYTHKKRSLGNVVGAAGVVVLSVLCKCLGWPRFQYLCVSMFVNRECGSIKGKCGVIALACKEPTAHKTKTPNPLLQSKNGNSLNCPCFSVHAFLVLVTVCHEIEYTAQLFLDSFVQPVFLPLSKAAHSECGGERVGETKENTGVSLLPKPHNHQDTCCNYPEHLGSWDACKCLSAL